MTETTLLLSVSGIPDRFMHGLVGDLNRTLAEKGIASTTVAPPVVADNSRGDASLFGQLAVELFSSGALVALIGCLKAYLSREPKLVVNIERKNGDHVTINAKNITDRGLMSALQAIAGLEQGQNR